jgi:hypothetical protein
MDVREGVAAIDEEDLSYGLCGIFESEFEMHRSAR